MSKKKPNKKDGRRDTIRQKRLVKLILDNLGNIGKGEKAMTMTQIMITAGYAESTAHEQSKILAGIQHKLDPFVNILAQKRDMALNAITQKKINLTGVSTLAYVVDIFTKNHQLLSNKPTQIEGSNLTPARKAELDALLSQ